MRAVWLGTLLIFLLSGGAAHADGSFNAAGAERVNSRYCTIWFERGVDVEKVNKKVKVNGIRSRIKLPKTGISKDEIAAKCDILFRRAEEVLDMYPAGVHVTIKVVNDQSQISRIHQKEYRRPTEAIAIYLFQYNTIYAVGSKISDHVLIHEMAHSIIDHYFGVRPPRKVEELLAMHVDAQMRDY